MRKPRISAIAAKTELSRRAIGKPCAPIVIEGGAEVYLLVDGIGAVFPAFDRPARLFAGLRVDAPNMLTAAIRKRADIDAGRDLAFCLSRLRQPLLNGRATT